MLPEVVKFNYGERYSARETGGWKNHVFGGRARRWLVRRKMRKVIREVVESELFVNEVIIGP